MASRQLDTTAKPEKRQKDLDKGMTNLCKQLPASEDVAGVSRGGGQQPAGRRQSDK